MSNRLRNLRELLAAMPPGPLTGVRASDVESLLIECWDELDGSSAEGTEPWKLKGRTESLEWRPPDLTFAIERHGGTVLGSTRAALHRWRVNVELGTATTDTSGFRQLSRPAPKLDVAPLSAKIVRAIVGGNKHPALVWKDGRAEFHIGKIIPDSGPKETVHGRRRRLRDRLKADLKAVGWRLVLQGSRSYIEKDGDTGKKPPA